MQLSDAVEVIEASSVNTANSLLENGWKLIAVSSSSSANGHVGPCYVLARDASSPSLKGKDTWGQVIKE